MVRYISSPPHTAPHPCLPLTNHLPVFALCHSLLAFSLFFLLLLPPQLPRFLHPPISHHPIKWQHTRLLCCVFTHFCHLPFGQNHLEAQASSHLKKAFYRAQALSPQKNTVSPQSRFLTKNWWGAKSCTSIGSLRFDVIFWWWQIWVQKKAKFSHVF